MAGGELFFRRRCVRWLFRLIFCCLSGPARVADGVRPVGDGGVYLGSVLVQIVLSVFVDGYLNSFCRFVNGVGVCRCVGVWAGVGVDAAVGLCRRLVYVLFRDALS